MNADARVDLAEVIAAKGRQTEQERLKAIHDCNVVADLLEKAPEESIKAAAVSLRWGALAIECVGRGAKAP